jgi:hypothetical protein
MANWQIFIDANSKVQQSDNTIQVDGYVDLKT